VTKRAALAASVASLAHLDWIWIPAAVVLESASMAALAGMQRRLLVAGGTNVGVWPMLATTFAANALSVSVAWRLTPWIARARLALITRLRSRPLAPDRHVNWQVWAQASRGHRTLWRTFLAEQRALVRELDELVTSVPSVKAPVLLLTDPKNTLVPVGTARRLAEALPDARLQLVEGVGHHLPRRAHAAVADAV